MTKLVAIPLRLAYEGASTIKDANGVTVAECRDAETAEALINAVNTLAVIADGATEEPQWDARAAMNRLESEE